MSESSQETLLSIMVEPPETDSDEFEIEERLDKAIYESSKIDIIDHIDHEDFKYVWLNSKEDIQVNSIKRQAIFAEQVLDKITEMYDFSFPTTITLETQYDLDDFYEFLEFLEYDNIRFLSYVWKILNPENFLKLDIKVFCETNSKNIIKEVEEQLDIHPQSKLITIFLSSFYKEKFIDWFIKKTKRNLINIQIEMIT